MPATTSANASAPVIATPRIDRGRNAADAPRRIVRTQCAGGAVRVTGLAGTSSSATHGSVAGREDDVGRADAASSGMRYLRLAVEQASYRSRRAAGASGRGADHDLRGIRP